MGPELHRLSEHREPWWFASYPAEANGEAGGRFDLPSPEGTCYLAEELDGALCEKLLRTPKRVVPLERLSSLLHATVSVRSAPPTVDLASKGASAVGLNAEVHTNLDYEVTRSWAKALRAAGWDAISYLLRGDAALQCRGVALFGRRELHGRAPAGLRTRVNPIDIAAATDLLRTRGVRVLSMKVVPPAVGPP